MTNWVQKLTLLLVGGALLAAASRRRRQNLKSPLSSRTMPGSGSTDSSSLPAGL